jgi:hypothetical protein
MTAKEKAFELYKMYNNIIIDEVIEMKITYLLMTNKMAKKAALIAVDEMQQLIKDLSSCKNRFIYIIDEMNYWNEVKQEINKL